MSSTLLLLLLLLCYCPLNSRATSTIDCDFACIYKEWNQTLTQNTGRWYDDHVLVPSTEHLKYFGNALNQDINRLQRHMGFKSPSKLALHPPYTLSLSYNEFQLRLIGYYYQKKKQGVRAEYIYTLEEQGFVSVAIGASMMPTAAAQTFESAVTKISIDSSKNQSNIFKFPALVSSISSVTVLQLGVIGVERAFVSNNVALNRARNRMPTVAKIEFDTFTGILRNNDVQVGAVRIIGKIPLTSSSSSSSIMPASNHSAFLNTVIRNTRVRRGRVMIKSDKQLGIEDGINNKPWTMVALDTAYGHNAASHGANQLIAGNTLSLGLEDITISKKLKIIDASGLFNWAPLSYHKVNLGLVGEIRFKIFKTYHLFMLRASVSSSEFVSALPSINFDAASPGVINVGYGLLPMTIGNIVASGTLTLGIPIPTMAVFGCQVNLGWNDKTQMTLVGMIQVDLLNPMRNFLYLKSSKITFQSLINTVTGSHRLHLPKFIGDTGITGIDHNSSRHRIVETFDRMKIKPPDSNSTSQSSRNQVIITFAPFALQTNVIAEINNNAVITPGLSVYGQANILGVGASVFVRVNHMNLGFIVDIELDRVSLGSGLLEISGKNSTGGGGPLLYTAMQILPNNIGGKTVQDGMPVAGFKLEGFVNLFGASAALEVAISSSDGFDFSSELEIWNWCRASVNVSVNTTNRRHPAIRVLGNVHVGSLKDLAKGFVDSVLKKISGLGHETHHRVLKSSDEIEVKSSSNTGSRRKQLRKKIRSIVEKIGKGLGFISKMKLLSLKFDITNAEAKKRLPVVAEFEFVLFGMHLMRYRRKNLVLSQESFESQEYVETIAAESELDIEACVAAACKESGENDHSKECLSSLTECNTGEYNNF